VQCLAKKIEYDISYPKFLLVKLRKKDC